MAAPESSTSAGSSPTASPRKSFWRSHLGPIVVGAGIVLLDHLSKWWAIAALKRWDYATGQAAKIELIPGCLMFRYAENTGAAFSLFSEHPALLTLVNLAISTGIAIWYFKTPLEHRMSRLGLALVLGGAAGNLIDRIFRGAVVDFIEAYWRSYHWPTFNVADSAICIGIGILLLWAHREQITEPNCPTA